jgi:hypothetical protein
VPGKGRKRAINQRPGKWKLEERKVKG